MEDSLIIGISFANGDDTGVLIVGRQGSKGIDIINAFMGEEALEIYNKLITKKEK